MLLQSGGADLFYIDESGWDGIFAITAIRIPFIRKIGSEVHFVWEKYLESALTWRRAISADHQILFRHELHGNELIQSKGLYHKTGRNLNPDEALATYRGALSSLEAMGLCDMVFTVTATESSRLAGQRGIHAGIMGLFQRIRRHCVNTNVNGMLFFDGGHERDYAKLYRQATRYLPSGRDGVNLPLDMFVKDANFKVSELSYFIQMADLVCHSAMLKLRFERNALTAKRVRRGHHTLYNHLPPNIVNLQVTTRRDDGIAPI